MHNGLLIGIIKCHLWTTCKDAKHSVCVSHGLGVMVVTMAHLDIL